MVPCFLHFITGGVSSRVSPLGFIFTSFCFVLSWLGRYVLYSGATYVCVFGELFEV